MSHRILIIILSTLIVITALLAISSDTKLSLSTAPTNIPEGPGPTVGEVKRRGIFSYFVPRFGDMCSNQLLGPVKSCSPTYKGHQLGELNYGVDGFMQHYVNYDAIKTLIEQHHIDNGLQIERSKFISDYDTLPLSNMRCIEQVPNDYDLNYLCTKTLDPKRSEFGASLNIEISYQQAIGKFSYTAFTLGKKLFNKTLYVGSQPYDRLLILDNVRDPFGKYYGYHQNEYHMPYQRIRTHLMQNNDSSILVFDIKRSQDQKGIQHLRHGIELSKPDRYGNYVDTQGTHQRPNLQIEYRYW